MARFLIAYDIADPNRLRRIARYFERHAQRRQKSVFLANVTESQLHRLLDEAAEQMRLSMDLLQAWRLAPDQSPDGVARGALIPCEPRSVIYGPGLKHFVEPP